MRLGHIRHKGLRQAADTGDVSGLPPGYVEKIGNMITYLVAAKNEGSLGKLVFWRAHRLKGDRKGTWALHVSPNWRLTFRVQDDTIVDLDLEDYH